MPIFDFACQDCGKKFDLMISNRDKDKVTCPECGSSKVRQLLSLFNTTSSGGSKTVQPSCSAGCPTAASGG
ncbi:MAG TPA: zinc ribbon domain-containing protein [Syntrophomonadaceae bacterium]|nr:zinc ribbon domain-containing protein [Syntrophomonadaceae bacterium]HQE23881.1 zinc ribbon domain-containing protein [Syntrophomonadaceae bacterium]